MSSHQNFQYHSRGFSLVEIMVGMVISLLSMLIILQVFSAFEGQKRTSTSGSDAQTNGSIALFTIERDIRNAGSAFGNVPAALGCKINRSYNGINSVFSLQPIVIENGAGGLPDKITTLAGGEGGWSVPTKIIKDHPSTSVNFFVKSIIGIKDNDLMIAFDPEDPTKDCTLFQVTDTPNSNKLVHHRPTSPYNPSGGANIYPPGGYGIKTILFNLGQMIERTYSISNVNELLVEELAVAAAPLPLMPDIVNLQAQYGFDARPGNPPDKQVTIWQDSMIDADNNGKVGDSGDITRMVAVRLAIVARSGQQEKFNSRGACDTTTVPPTWANGSIDVSMNPNWQCYRYKTFETIVPLRNLIWRQI